MVENTSLQQILKYSKVFFYGIGNQFKECFSVFDNKDIRLFDSSAEKIGKLRDGRMIYPPEDLQKYFDGQTAVVISSIYNQYEIAEALCSKWNIPVECIFMYTSARYEKYVYNPRLVEKNWNKIIEFSERLADHASREYYLQSIQARLKRSPILLRPNKNSMYAGEYGDIVKLKRGDRIIDCGAYTGDTAAMYLERLDHDCMVFAIEPFRFSFDKMAERIQKNKWQDKVFPYNNALGNREAEASMNYNRDDFAMGIHLSSKDGELSQKIRIRTLDDLFSGQEVSYIKMDIEGEERNALEGGRHLISQNKPRLMISAYHKIEDFWELPEIIWDIDSGYQIYAGHAPGCSTEMELYCIHKSERQYG